MRSRGSMFVIIGLGATLLVQSAHMVEHVAQVVQKFLLRMSEAHGLLGSVFDFEWVHFAFNTTLEAALITCLIMWYRGAVGPAPWAMMVVVGLQGYHTIEHVVKMIQHYGAGVAAPKGILGAFVPVIWLHFWLNLIVLGLIAGAWFAMRDRIPGYGPADGGHAEHGAPGRAVS